MKIKLLAIALILAGPAYGQSTLVDVERDDLIVKTFGLSVDQLDDLDVYDASGALVGDVEDVLGSAPDQPVALAVDADKYLGADGEDVVFAFEQVKLEDGRLVTTLSKEEITKLPRSK